MKATPASYREILERNHPDFHGWYSEPSEGFAAPYEWEDQPERVRELVERIKRRVRRPA